MLERLVPGLECDVERLREVLAEVVRGPCLQRATVAHQGFNRVRAQGPGELLALALEPLDDRHGQHLLCERGVQVEDHPRLGFRLFEGLVRRVALLPEELGRSQKRSCHFLPTDDVRPLIDEDGQVAPRLHPLGVHGPDDRFRRWPDHEPFLQLLSASVRDVGDLRREPFDVFGLPVQQVLGNEEREVRIDVTGPFELAIEGLLQQLPDSVAVRADDHAPLDRRIVGQFRAPHDVQVPLREVARARRNLGDEGVVLVHEQMWAGFDSSRVRVNGWPERLPLRLERSPPIHDMDLPV